MDSLTQYYRKINSGFLNKPWREGSAIGFDIYYKVVKGLSKPKFLIFAHYEPGNAKKIRDMMANETSQDFYIHETDLIKYYKDFLISDMEKDLKNGQPPEIILQKSYGVTKLILKEYFENIGSSRILKTIKDVVQVIINGLQTGNIGLIDAYKISDKDNDHYSHCASVGLYCILFGMGMKMDSQAIQELGQGGMLLDIEKKSIPSRTLEKPGTLTAEEFLPIRKHPMAGKKVLEDLNCFNKNVLTMVAQHHEKYNGTGYPRGSSGTGIALFARMASIADVFSALVAERHHRRPLTPYEALTEMKDHMPCHFDEQLLIDFIKLVVQSQRPSDPPLTRAIPAESQIIS